MNILDYIKTNHIDKNSCDLIETLFGAKKCFLRNNEKIIVYGAGSAGREIAECLMLHGVDTEFFCDENAAFLGKTLLERPILSIQNLLDHHKKRFIVIGIQKQKLIVYEQLIKMGFDRVGVVENDEQFYYYLQFPKWKIDMSELDSESERINHAFEILADQKSQDIFKARLLALTSYADFRLYKQYCELSDYPVNYPEAGKTFASSFENEMYFANDLVNLKLDEINLIDCGAYNGDSFLEFNHKLDKAQINRSIAYCFEPDLSNFKALQKNLEAHDRVKLFNLGVWSEKTSLQFASSAMMYRTESCVTRTDYSLGKVIQATSADTIIDVDSIDNLIYPARIHIIKMDVEGSESEALLGGRKTIARHYPQLIISAYHKKDDMWRLPLLIRDMFQHYRIYFRQFSFSWSETVLIAIKK